ncbi:SSI family serine proteinase inhibitor [Actinokineospora guangxiensis]|uniref:SSI family serine proteinase inhibitor n=1 Tax=Actinokineospora guangxiensis TaxID=1490288 RepID=A0ABW0EPN1_9PSEU
MKRKTVAAIAAVGAALVAGPVAIAAQHDSEDRGVLALTVTGRDGGTKVGTLHCGPDGGTHPSASSACDQLSQVNGEISQLNTDPTMMCTLEYDPVTATARGTWDGKVVDFRETFPNKCAMWSYTGTVFNL